MTYKELLEDAKKTHPELSAQARELQERVIRTKQQQSRLSWMGNIYRIRTMKKVAFAMIDKAFAEFKEKQ